MGWRKPRKEKIFVNYRRDDSSGFAGRLSDTLAAYFGRDRVFRDVTGIDYGHDFEKVIDEKIDESGAVIVLIGEKWTSVTDAEGQRRLDDPGDYVSREITAALDSDVPVFPVLIGDTAMPRKEDLPERLHGLVRRNAMTITDERWNFDVARLTRVLSIDVPGSLMQRRLDALKLGALLALAVSGIFATIMFCAAVADPAAVETGLREAGFTPLAAAAPFMAILLAGTLSLVAGFVMEERNRLYAWAASAFAYVATFAAFIHYVLTNVEQPSWSLVVNFGASMVATIVVLALIAMAGFRAK